MQFLWKYIDDLVGKGLEVKIIAELLFYFSVSFVPMALPLAILLSSLMTFGNLGENNELLAIKSAGISLQRIMFPLILLTLIMSIGAFFFSNNILPYTNLKSRSLLYDIAHQKPELQIKEGIFYNGIEGYSIRITEKNHKTNLLKKIKIYDHKARSGNVHVTIADSGYMKMTADTMNLIITLYNGYSYEEMQIKKKRRHEKTYPQQRNRFDEQVIVTKLSGFGLNRTDEQLFKNNYQMMNLKQLSTAEDSLKRILEKKSTTFAGNLLQSHYFKQIKKPVDRDTFFDESEIEKNITFDLHESLRNLSKMEQIGALSLALNFARTSKNYISTSERNYTSNIRHLRRHEIEWQRKLTLSFACFVFFFIGAPLGSIIRKGGLGMPTVVSVLFFILYYVLSMSCEKFVREDVLPAFEGMWTSPFILLALGIFLTYKATTDSVILNIDTYLTFFKKYFRFIKNLK